jgi:hypothetical protein
MGSSITVTSSSFSDSTWEVEMPKNFAEIYINAPQFYDQPPNPSLYAYDNCFIFGSGINKDDHEGMYIRQDDTANEIKQQNNKCDQVGFYLYYFSKSDYLISTESEVGSCFVVYQTPAPTIAMTPQRTPDMTATPLPTPEITKMRTQLPTPDATRDPEINKQEDGGLTKQQKITMAWAIPVGVVAIALIVVIVFCALKDHRSAERAKDEDPDADIDAFPDV